MEELAASSSSRAIQAEDQASRDDLDPDIWCRLPYEFLCLVLERVSTDALMRWRRVSKSWISDFMRIRISDSLWLPPVGETVPMYHVPIETFTMNPQEEAPVSFIVSTFNKNRFTWFDFRLPLHESHPKAELFHNSNLFSTGGLVLLDLSFTNLNHTRETSITVLNPTTLTVRQLPPPPDARARPLGIIKSWDSRSYAVVASMSTANEQGSRFFMFESENNEWHYCGNSMEQIWPTPIASAVSIGSLLYFLLERGIVSNRKKYQMFAFDVITQTCLDWGEVPRHSGGGNPALMEIGGFMFYVARVDWNRKRNRQLTWKFYKLDPESLKWDEQKRMPMEVHRQLIERMDNRAVRVSGAGNFVYFYGMSISHLGPHRVLAHNLSADTWYWLHDVSTYVGGITVTLKQSVLISLEPSLMPV